MILAIVAAGGLASVAPNLDASVTKPGVIQLSDLGSGWRAGPPPTSSAEQFNGVSACANFS
jgi:hypothetical protein